VIRVLVVPGAVVVGVDALRVRDRIPVERRQNANSMYLELTMNLIPS
jgi:hypothetical protein